MQKQAYFLLLVLLQVLINFGETSAPIKLVFGVAPSAGVM